MVGEIAAGALIGGSGLLTIIISKIRCFYKHAAQFPCGCGFTDSQLADNDDVHISSASVNGIDLLYVGKRKTHKEDGYDSDDVVRRSYCPNNIYYN